MSDLEQVGFEQRLLTLLPTGKDAALTSSILREADVENAGVVSIRELAERLGEGAAALLLAEEALTIDSGHLLAAILDQQPLWSDLPILVVTRQGADSATAKFAVEALGNVTLLERPIRVGALVSAVRTALRARKRQYELREQFEALRRSEQNLTDFFENATVGLQLFNADGVIQRANQSELELLGYAAPEYVGHHLSEFHVDAALVDDLLRHLNAGETIVNCEARVRAKDGSIKCVLLSANVLWENGKFIHTRCFTRDITARRNAEEALREADRRKDVFLATLAHELRNPLAPLRNSLHILQLTGSTDPAAERVYEMMERQVDHMVRLVDDLMEVSRITRGKIELHKEQLDVAAIIRSAVETSRPWIEAARHQLAISLSPEPLFVDGDLVRLAQVLTNLLNNAAKYTENGGQIWLVARRVEGDAVISVRDNGIGIPADTLPHIFELFMQADHATSRAQGGLGIGLSLVRSLVDMHGGSIEAKSAGPGQGSEFIVRLPLAGSRFAPSLRPRELQPTSSLPARRVLVVDDNRDAAESLGMLLKFLGSEVRVVGDGIAALQALRSYQPTVVLLDIGMPGMDGYEVARRIRELPEFKDTLLVALTGWGQEEDRRRSQSAGFDHHLIKPADIGALQALLNSTDRRTHSASARGTF